MKDNLPPRQYAEQVLGKGASSEQLDELHQLHSSAHPVVTHGRGVVTISEGRQRLRSWTNVSILSANPSTPTGPTPKVIAVGVAICNTDSGDQYSKSRGVAIAFGRALVKLRLEVEGVRHAPAA